MRRFLERWPAALDLVVFVLPSQALLTMAVYLLGCPVRPRHRQARTLTLTLAPTLAFVPTLTLALAHALTLTPTLTRTLILTLT